MGIYFRSRRKLGTNSWLNLSKTGASVSQRIGPLTINSRGRITLRLSKGTVLAQRTVTPTVGGDDADPTADTLLSVRLR